jgi:hypothetical protein
VCILRKRECVHSQKEERERKENPVDHNERLKGRTLIGLKTKLLFSRPSADEANLHGPYQGSLKYANQKRGGGRLEMHGLANYAKLLFCQQVSVS